jgi:hypothetical protein
MAESRAKAIVVEARPPGDQIEGQVGGSKEDALLSGGAPTERSVGARCRILRPIAPKPLLGAQALAELRGIHSGPWPPPCLSNFSEVHDPKRIISYLCLSGTSLSESGLSAALRTTICYG